MRPVKRYRAVLTSSIDERDRRWLGAALTVSTLLYITYLTFYPYPAQGAGFYLAVAEQIAAAGYGLPKNIPHYTIGGVPYAYPPLLFYPAAIAHDAGVDPFVYSRVVPGLVTIVALIPFYLLARAVLGSPQQAGVASLLLAVTPASLQWHVAAGGIIRAPAFLFALIACYAGWLLFTIGERRWLVATTAGFAVTLLTHPVYATFVGVSLIVFWAVANGTLRGLVYGVAVAVGGLLVAAPWWIQVAATHGPAVFLGAAGTHEGLGGGLVRIADSFIVPLVTLDGSLLFYLLAFGGAVYLVTCRRFLLPVWIAVVGYALRQPRFLFVPGSMAAAVLLVDVASPRLRSAGAAIAARLDAPRVAPSRLGQWALATLVVGTLLLSGWLAVAPATGPDVVPPDDDERYAASPLPPMYAIGDDIVAMRWIEANTPPGARFVVLGDAAEWFPYLTDRTMLVSPWGAEWEGSEAFREQLALYDYMAACETAGCATDALQNANLNPNYLYLQTGHYTVRRVPHYRGEQSRRSFVRSERYRVVYANDGGFVVRVVN